MKKIIILILTILFIVGCGINTSKISEIEIVNPQNGERNIILKDSDAAKLIIAAINKKEKTSDDISELFAFELYIKKNAESDGYIISFDINNKKVYVSKDDMAYRVKDNIAHDLLLDESFSYAYVDETVNKINLYHNENPIVPNVQYDWSFKNIDGKLSSKSGTISDGNETILINKDDKLDMIYDVNPDSQITRVYYKGEVIQTGKSVSDVIKLIQYDGEYFIESQVKWNQRNDTESYGDQTISFIADIDNPADFKVITKENYPGNILIVSVENLNKDETVKIKTDAVKTDVEMYPYNDKYMSIFPIDLNAKPGDYDIYAVFNEGKINEYIQTKKINIINKDFKTQYLTVSEELNDSNNDDKSIKEFAQYVKPARTESVTEKLWRGEFLMPINGRLTTDFAETRYVNNVLSSRHSGVDLAAPAGTEVKAPNNGHVTLAMNGLLSTGNTLVLDHGMGLFTSYYHLDTILVKTGDFVKKGDVIGTVGTTGFSTGPHLHYAISIYNAYVNTYQPLSGIFD